MKLKNSNVFKILNNPHMLHIATISHGLREFYVMICTSGPKKGNVYIEELVFNTIDFKEDVFGNFKYIQDHNLAQDLAGFAHLNGIMDIAKNINELIDTNRLHLLDEIIQIQDAVQ